MPVMLFMVDAAFGHYYATFAMASALAQSGYRVAYAGGMAFRELVLSQGYEFYPLDMGRLINTEAAGWRAIPRKVRFMFSNLFDRLSDTQYQLFMAEAYALEKLVKKLKPGIVFVDAFLCIPCLILQQSGVKCIVLQTMLDTGKAARIPPLNSGFIPGDTLVARLHTEWLWQLHQGNKLVKRVLYQVLHAGQDNRRLAMRKLRGERAYETMRLLSNRVMFHPQVAGLPEFILTAAAFDFPWRGKKAYQYYVGPSVARNRTDGVITRQSFRDVPAFREMPANAKIVYCSLGTLGSLDQELQVLFFNKLLRVIRGMQGCFLIVTMSKNAQTAISESIPPNAAVFEKVPQLEVLTMCHAMITHGGLNSIKECISMGVPMIVYPLNARWDQAGNAARVVFHGLGVRGSMTGDAEEDIQRKLDEVLHQQTFKENVMHMKTIFDQYDDARLVTLVESLMQKNESEE